MKRYHMFTIGRINIVKMSQQLKTIYKFIAILSIYTILHITRKIIKYLYEITHTKKLEVLCSLTSDDTA